MDQERRGHYLMYAAALVAAIYGWLQFVATFDYPGAIGLNYNAPGTDWMVFYTAIRLALAHHFAATHDGIAFTSYLNLQFVGWLSQNLTYRPWVYPPGMLVMLLPFGAMRFIASYLAFQVVTASFLALALLYRSTNRHATLVALAAITCPAASINVVDGQSAFLVAGLLILGVRLLSGKPYLAGMVLGLVSVKPQFALLIPVVLLTLREWRGMLGAMVSVLALVVISAMLVGPGEWLAWAKAAMATYGDPNTAWVGFGRLWGNSVYACLVLLGVSPTMASLMQIVAIAAAAMSTYVAFCSPLAVDRKLAILLAATILAAPHSSTYDAILLTIAGTLCLAEHTTPRTRHVIVFFVFWLSPMIGPPAIVPVGRFMPLVIAGFIALIVMPSGWSPVLRKVLQRGR